jgi:putative transposase
VLFAALSTWGAPSAIGSSGGGIFSCHQAMNVYASLSIRKERIEPRQAWQNLIEAHFTIMWNCPSVRLKIPKESSVKST